jgi:flagellar biogenesis protein FliO
LLERYVSAERQAPTAGDWVFMMAVILGIVLLLIGTFVVLVWLVKQLWNAM